MGGGLDDGSSRGKCRKPVPQPLLGHSGARGVNGMDHTTELPSYISVCNTRDIVPMAWETSRTTRDMDVSQASKPRSIPGMAPRDPFLMSPFNIISFPTSYIHTSITNHTIQAASWMQGTQSVVLDHPSNPSTRVSSCLTTYLASNTLHPLGACIPKAEYPIIVQIARQMSGVNLHSMCHLTLVNKAQSFQRSLSH